MGGKSKSSQKAEGDVVFNNVDYGGSGGGGSNALKNFNVGRENTLKGNVFNVTDSGATANALFSNRAVTQNANNTVRWGTQFALGANEAVSKRAIDNSTATAFKGLDTAASLAKINQSVGDNAINSSTATAFKGLDTAVSLAKINQSVGDNAIDAVTKTTSEAIKASDNAQSKAFGFAERSNNQFARQSGEARKDAAKAARESAASAFSFAKDSGRQISDLATRSQDKAYNLSRDAIGTYEDLVGETGDQVTDAQVTSASATNKALDYVFQSSKSATERQSESLVKYGAYGAVGVVGLISLAAVLRR
jgi:hypothetical protein